MNNELNLFHIPENEKNKMLSEKIEFSKMYGQRSSESRNNIKTGKCYYCHSDITSYCNSHSIPASVLENITEDGKLLTHSGVIESPLFKPDTGVNQAGTFYIICRDCDSKIFKDYENMANYDSKPTQKMLAQIAMKNYLKSIYKRTFEISFNHGLGKNTYPLIDVQNELKDFDLKENIRGFNRAKKVDSKSVQDEYFLFFNEKLNYVVPLAFQCQIALAVDIDGTVINNLYNHDPSYKVKMLHLAIFPLKESSVIMAFIDKKDKAYSQFIRQFNKLAIDEKTALLNYIVFLYSEEFFLSKKIDEEIMKSEILKIVSGKTGVSFTPSDSIHLDSLNRNYSLSNFKEIPNLLSEKYKIN